MKYKVIIVRHGQQEQEISCATLKEAEKTLEDLKSAFPRAIRLGEMALFIREEDL